MNRVVAMSLALLSIASLAACAPSPTTESKPTTPTATVTPSGKPSPNAIPKVSETRAAQYDDRAEQYAAAIALFPLELPEGYTFPGTVPAGNWSGLGSGHNPLPDGRTVAFHFWRCAVAQAARDAQVLSDDYDTGQQLLEQIKAVSDQDIPGNSGWASSVVDHNSSGNFNGSLEGETGMCYFWLRPHGRWGED